VAGESGSGRSGRFKNHRFDWALIGIFWG
jgi:hypothetical protein